MYTIQQLIDHNILLPESTDQDLKRDGFVSYVVPDNLVVLMQHQETDEMLRVNYVQFILDDEDCWVVQLDGSNDTPNNHTPFESVNVQVFKQMADPLKHE